jgi:hypothetical protein
MSGALGTSSSTIHFAFELTEMLLPASAFLLDECGQTG